MKNKPLSLNISNVFACIGICLLAMTILTYSYSSLGLPRIYHTMVPKLAVLRAAALAFFVSVLVRLLLCKGFAARFTRAVWPLAIWYGWRLASLLWSEFGWATVATLADDACLFVCALGLVAAFNSRNIALFAKVTVAVAALMALGVFFLMPDVSGHPPFANQNLGGTIFALAAVGALCHLVGTIRSKATVTITDSSPNHRGRIAGCDHSRISPWPAIVVSALLFVLFFIGLVKVGSAGAFVGLLAGAYVLLLVSFKKRIIVLAATTVLIASAGAVFWSWPETRERLLGPRFETTSWVRVYIWMGAGEMLSDRPVVGHGAGTFGLVNAKYQPTESYLHKGLEKASYYAHSFPLAVACETGLTGLFILAGVIVFALWRAQTAVWRDEGARYFLAAGLAPLGAMLAHGAVGVSLYQPHIQVFMWMVIALVLGESTRQLPVPVSPRHTRMTAGYATRVIATLVIAFGAVALWGRYFTQELQREAAFSRGYFCWKDALRQRAGYLELDCAKRDFAVAMHSPYITIYSLEARIRSAQVLYGLGEQYAEAADSVEAELIDVLGGEKIEDIRNGIEDMRSQARHFFETAVKQLESVEDTAYAFRDVDEKLGFALIKLGKFNKDRAQVQRGCEYLVGYFERNPFGFPRESGTSPPIQAQPARMGTGGGRAGMVLRTLDEHLADPELLHRFAKALENAIDIMGARFDELSRKQIEYLHILSRYRDKLSERLWAREA